MVTSKLHYSRYNNGRMRGGATVRRYYLFGYLVFWRTVDTWLRVSWPRA